MKELRIAFILTPVFKHWADAVIEELKSQGISVPALGFIGGDKRYFSRMDKSQFELGVTYTHELEKEWIISPAEEIDKSAYKNLLGDKIISEILIADRQLGRCFVSGGLVADSVFLRDVETGGVDARVNYLFNMFSYIDRNIQENRLDVFFFYSIAGAFSLSVYHICKARGIQCLRLTSPRVKDFYTVDSSHNDQFFHIQKNYQERLLHNTKDDYYYQADKYLDAYVNQPIQPGYQINVNKMVKENNSLIGKTKILAKMLASNFYRRNEYYHNSPKYNYQLKFKVIRNFRNSYNFFENSSIIGSKSFYYYPLHVEPEASTMVYSPWCTDQLNLLEYISKKIHLGEYVVVKEHISCIGKRPVGFYERIKSLYNVIFVHPSCNSIELINKSKAVVSITGTASWEAFLLGKPSMVFGKFLYPFIKKGYKDLSHLPLDSSEEEFSIESIEFPDKEEKIQLLASIFSLSFEFPGRLFWYSDGGIGVVNENRHIAKKIADNIVLQSYLNT